LIVAWVLSVSKPQRRRKQAYEPDYRKGSPFTETRVFQTPQRLADTGAVRMRRKRGGGGHVVGNVPSFVLDSERKGLM
jgi:hypothetical protein